MKPLLSPALRRIADRRREQIRLDGVLCMTPQDLHQKLEVMARRILSSPFDHTDAVTEIGALALGYLAQKIFDEHNPKTEDGSTP